jgi:hypothetical protein
MGSVHRLCFGDAGVGCMRGLVMNLNRHRQSLTCIRPLFSLLLEMATVTLLVESLRVSIGDLGS